MLVKQATTSVILPTASGSDVIQPKPSPHFPLYFTHWLLPIVQPGQLPSVPRVQPQQEKTAVAGGSLADGHPLRSTSLVHWLYLLWGP